MCGRYASTQSDAELVLVYDIDELFDDPPPPSWNVAPTDPVRIIAQRKPPGHSDDPNAAPQIQLRTARWGLIPSWSRTRPARASMINARFETVTTKPAFKAAAGRRRALIPALGYYEWQTTATGKIPHFLHQADGRPVAFAGLYEIWRDPELPDDHPDKLLWTSTIITRPAADALGHIHDRCPVIVPLDLHHDWLDCFTGDPATAAELLREIPEPHLQPRIVGRAVGNVRNNGPELIGDASELPSNSPHLPL